MHQLPAILQQSPNGDGSREVRAKFQDLRTALGDEALSAFCQAFAAANRLAALASATRLSKSIPFDGLKTRNQFTIFFLSLGVAHEAVTALSRLETELRRRGCEELLAIKELTGLREFRGRWGERLSERLRNKLAFHFDADCYVAGVRRVPGDASACVLQLDDVLGEAYFPIADDVLLHGTQECLNGRLTSESIREWATALWKDQQGLSSLLFDLFARVASKLTRP